MHECLKSCLGFAYAWREQWHAHAIACASASAINYMITRATILGTLCRCHKLTLRNINVYLGGNVLEFP